MKPQDFNEQICKALGLESKEVAGLTIELRPNDWPRVTVTRYLRGLSVADKIATAAHEVDFTLSPLTHPQVTEAFEFKPKGAQP